MPASTHFVADPRTGEPAIAAIAMGSNLGDRRAHIAAAIRGLAALPHTQLLAASEPIETDPVGPAGQGPYLNAAALVRTRLTPHVLMSLLLGIELARHRVRDASERWGPRTLDLDLLVHADAVIDEPRLTLPHPRLAERLFVLRPLVAIAPDLHIPLHDRTAAELLADLQRALPPTEPRHAATS